MIDLWQALLEQIMGGVSKHTHLLDDAARTAIESLVCTAREL